MTAPLVPLEPEGPPSNQVFVVHGRNEAARDAMFTFLRALGLQPIEWSQAVEWTGKGSPYIGDVLEVAFARARAVVVLMTPDEIAFLKKQYGDADDEETKAASQARPNVLFEAGMAMGRDPDRTILVELGKVRPFSDVGGRHALRMNNTAAKRNQLAGRLRTAGCDVNTKNDDWLNAGDFTPPADDISDLPVGTRLPTTKRQAVNLDAKYHRRGSNSDRLELINKGPEDIFDVTVTLPEEAGSTHLVGDFPEPKVPAGKSLMIIAAKFMGGGREAFDITVTGHTADGTEVDQQIWIDTRG